MESEQESAKVGCVFCEGRFGSREGYLVLTLHLQHGASATSL